jgi:DNA-binding beta-propeller fold protein YncE
MGAGNAAAASRSVYVPNDLNVSSTVSQFTVGAAGSLSPKTPATAASADANAHEVVIAPDGKSVYVLDGSGVSQYDVGIGGLLSLKTPASVAAGTDPATLAISPDGKSLYVANTSSISQYDVGAGGAMSAKTPSAVPVPGGSLQQVAVSPDGKSVYVTDFGGSVLQYDVGAGGVLSPKVPATVPSGIGPQGIAVSPDGTHVYVVNRGGKEVALFHVGPTGALTKTGTTVAGNEPTWIAISPNGKSAYVVDRNGGATGAILQYDVGQAGVLLPKTPATVAAGTNASGIAISPDGESVYVSDNLSNDVAQYDVGHGGTLSPKTPATVAAGGAPAGVAVVPDQGPLASFIAHAAPAGSVTKFDGSASRDADGTIARYDWNFGDGSSAVSGGAEPTHTYRAPGRYTVRLTVTDDGGCSTALVFTGQMAYCSGGPAATQTTIVSVRSIKPRLTGVSEAARRWREGNALPRIARAGKLPIGTTFRFRLNERVRMRFAFIKGRRVAGTLRFIGRAGSHRVRFQGRLSKHKKLAPGRYTLLMTATDPAGRRARAKLTFTIVKS